MTGWYYPRMIASSDDLIPYLDRPLRRPARIVAAALGAMALIAVAGCGSSGPAASSKPVSARQALSLAANESQQVNSLTATISVRTSLTSASGISGSMQIRVKPTPLVNAVFTVSGTGAPHTQLQEILTNKALYLKDSALTKLTGKPWIAISFAALSSKAGVNFASLFQSLEGSNPLDQSKFFAASKNVRKVGTQTINGVATTEYSGSYAPSAALSLLTPKLRKQLEPMLRAMGTRSVQFQIWIDGSHLIRKAIEHETIAGQTATVSYTVTSVNQPVTVTLPPASQIAPLPKF